jgi:hypothetical protein
LASKLARPVLSSAMVKFAGTSMCHSLPIGNGQQNGLKILFIRTNRHSQAA